MHALQEHRSGYRRRRYLVAQLPRHRQQDRQRKTARGTAAAKPMRGRAPRTALLRQLRCRRS